MERVLDGKPRHAGAGTADSLMPDHDGSPGWSRKREAYRPAGTGRSVHSSVAYAELHAHSAYSFLDGASTPEELAEELTVIFGGVDDIRSIRRSRPSPKAVARHGTWPILQRLPAQPQSPGWMNGRRAGCSGASMPSS